MILKTYNEFLNENIKVAKGYKYKVYLVDYSKRKLGDFSKNYYYDHPLIFNGDAGAYEKFMKKNYPKAIEATVRGTGEERNQNTLFNKQRDSENFPLLPYLTVVATGSNGMSYISIYMITPLK